MMVLKLFSWTRIDSSLQYIIYKDQTSLLSSPVCDCHIHFSSSGAVIYCRLSTREKNCVSCERIPRWYKLCGLCIVCYGQSEMQHNAEHVEPGNGHDAKMLGGCSIGNPVIGSIPSSLAIIIWQKRGLRRNLKKENTESI